MKKLLFLCISGALSPYLYSQAGEFQLCGTDELMKKHYEKFPEQKKQEDAFNLELSQMIKSGKLASKLNKNAVYEIPIVVHVVGDGSPIGNVNNKSDADIIDWINYTNGIFSGSSSSGMASTSSVLPVKFVFAKINPNCNPTNGINRIDASHLPKYVSGGVNSDNTTNAVSASEITAMEQWDTSKYYNIYVVKKLTSNQGALNGFAYYPEASLDYSFMATSASAVTKQTLAHEFGHALGLKHTHEGYNTTSGDCPTNNDCTLEGDLVCDTEPMKSLYHPSVPYTCQTGQINPCTNQTYAGGERNVMAYTFCFRDLFTQGQADRATAQLFKYRQSLIDSPVATPFIDNNASLSTACIPTSITSPGNHGIGITSVKFGSINNHSPNYTSAANNFYENFIGNYCLGITKTTIPQNTATTITVAPGIHNAHTIKAYIDYNNNGQFDESTELILNQSGVNYGSFATASVTPPLNAVTNTPLRMRVIGDFNGTNITGCYTPSYGQVEDYTVIIEPQASLSVQNNIKTDSSFIVKDGSSVYVKSDEKISTLHIYDASGRLLTYKTNVNTSELKVPINQTNTIITVAVVLKDGKVIKEKIKF